MNSLKRMNNKKSDIQNGYHFCLAINDRTTTIPTITRETVEPMTLFGFKINPIKIRLNATIAMAVVNGNHFT